MKQDINAIRILSLALMLIFALTPYLSANDSIGPSSGNLWAGDLCGFGNGYLGFNSGIGSDLSIMFGTVSYGFSDLSEGRVKIGYANPESNDDYFLMLAVEAKYGLMNFDSDKGNDPFDLSFGGMFEITYYEKINVKEYGAFGIISLPLKLKSRRIIVPYFRVNIRIEVVSPKNPPGEGEADYLIGSNLGVRIDLAEKIDLYTEAQFDGNNGFYAGLHYKLF